VPTELRDTDSDHRHYDACGPPFDGSLSCSITIE